MWRSSLLTILVLAVLFWTHSTFGYVVLIANGSTFTFDSSEANFAPRAKGSGISGFVMSGSPADACSSLESILSTLQASSSPFLLTMRGNCSFEAKVRNAQDAGFAAAIIYNNESSSELVTRFHSICVDAWLTMWRAVCPICKRDARFEFPDLQASERTPLLSFNPRGGRGPHGTMLAASSESSPIQIPPTQADSKVGCPDVSSCSMGTASSSSHTFKSSPGNSFMPSSILNSFNPFRHLTTIECSLEAFRASPYFTPPSSSHNASPLLPDSYAAPCLLDCSPAEGSPSPLLCGSRDSRSKSFLNPSKADCASPAVGSSSPLSCGSRGSRSISFLNPRKA